MTDDFFGKTPPAAFGNDGKNDWLSDLWSQTEAAEQKPRREKIPAGEYIAAVEGLKLEATKQGKPKFTFTLKIVDGVLSGRLLWKSCVPSSPAAMAYFKADVAMCGANVSDGYDLESINDSITGQRLAISVNYRIRSWEGKSYENQNIYFNKSLSRDPSAPVDDFDVPF
tara:strand:+ start:17177 stop:17683 length:507 start_codon:yes stop_codon:yes gene_type:complete